MNQKELSEIRKIAGMDSYDEQVHQVIALASSIPIEDIARWHREELMNGLEGDLETLFWRITSERWMEVAPADFFKWADMMNYRQTDLHLSQWLVNDPEAAMAFLKSDFRDQCSRRLCNAIPIIGKTDPEMALELFSQNIEMISSQSGYYVGRLIRSFADKDLERVLEARASWPESVRRKASEQMALAVFKRDISEGLAFMEEEGVSWKNLSNLSYYSDRRALSSLLLENRDRLPEGMFEQMLEGAPNLFCSKNGLSLLQSTSEELGISEGAFSSLASSGTYIPMTKENQAQFMEILNGEILPLSRRKSILESKVSQWDVSDSEGLRAWLGSLDDPDLHGAADQALEDFDNRVEDEITGVSFSSVVEKLMTGKNMGESSQKMISRWTPEETQSALATFQNLPDDEKSRVFQSTLKMQRYYVKNFDFLKEVYAANAPAGNPPAEGSPPEVRNLLKSLDYKFLSFAGSYAESEPAEAAKWAAGLPEGEVRTSSIRGVINSWKKYSPSEAEAWIETLPAGDQEAAKAALTPRR